MKVKVSSTVPLTLHPACEHALNVVDRVWFRVTGEHPIVTGLQEEGHSQNSLHYGILGDVRCRAFDIRVRNLTEEEKEEIDSELNLRLGGGFEFDIVWEPSHMHCEYQPR